jgi:hypothetical protein
MVDKTQNNAKWVAAVASIIAVGCFVGLIVMLSTTYQCPVTDHPGSTKSNESEKAVNEIKSKIRKILSTFVYNSTDQEKDFQNKVTKLMLYIATDTDPEVESSVIKTLSIIVSDIRRAQVASPEETPSNEFQTSSDIAMANVLEKVMTSAKQSEPFAIEADSDIVELKITNFITSIVSHETNPIAKRKIFDVLSVVVRKERDQYMSTLGETDISTINSQMEDKASYATKPPSGKQVPSTVDETEKQIE